MSGDTIGDIFGDKGLFSSDSVTNNGKIRRDVAHVQVDGIGVRGYSFSGCDGRVAGEMVSLSLKKIACA